MAKAWNPNSPFMKALARVFDLMLLNVLFIVTSLPVVTMGASLAALHYCLLHMVRNEEEYIIRSYFLAFRREFKQATILWIIWLFAAGLLYVDYTLLDKLPGSSRQMMIGLLAAVAIVLTCILLYSYPLMARFENSLRHIVKNALVVSIVFFARTIAMAAILFGFCYLYYNLPLQATPFLLLFGFSFPVMLMAYIYTPVLKKMEDNERHLDD